MWESANRIFIKSSLIKFVANCLIKKCSVSTNLSPNTVALKTQSLAGRELMQAKLQEVLNIRPIKALAIYASSSKFSSTDPIHIKENFTLCLKQNIKKSVILENPIILTDLNLQEKVNQIKLLPMDLNNSIALTQCSLRQLSRISADRDNLMLRITYISEIFNISEAKVCEILPSKPFLLSIDLSHINTNRALFHELGIKDEDILKDLWILKYSTSFINRRSESFKKYGVENIKTWMIRCPEETLLNHVRRETETKNLLGESSVVQYLSNKLNCSEHIANQLIYKNPQLETKSIANLSETIDFLYKHNFTSMQICRIPKILLHSRKTTEKRILELSLLGKKNVNLYILTKSKKQYLQYIVNLMKSIEHT